MRLLSSRNLGGHEQEGHQQPQQYLERRLTVTVEEGGAVRLHCDAQLQRLESLHSVLWYYSSSGEPEKKAPIFRYLAISEEMDPEAKKSAWLHKVKGKFSIDVSTNNIIVIISNKAVIIHKISRLDNSTKRKS